MAVAAATTNRDGYGAPYLVPVFVAATTSSLWLNAYPLQWIGIPHVFMLAAMAMMLFVHELLRPFCSSFLDVCVLFVTELWVLTCAVVNFVKRGCKPTFPEWTLKYEVFLALAKRGGELGGVNMIKPRNVVAYRRISSFTGDVKRRIYCLFSETRTEFFQHNGLEHIWIKSTTKNKDAKQQVQAKRVVVLYFHGGTYAFLSPRFYAPFGIRLRDHIVKAIAKVNGDGKIEQPVQVDLLLANYRKLPEHNFPVPFDDALAMYDYLVKVENLPPSQIVVAGDNAGGGLTMATLVRLRNAKRAMPAAGIVMSPWANPWVDHPKSKHCFISVEMVTTIQAHCIAAASSSKQGKAILQDAESETANLKGLPPLFILAGDADTVYSQSLGLAENARRHGVKVELDVHKRMPHVFCLLSKSMLPASEVGMANFAAFAVNHLVATRQS